MFMIKLIHSKHIIHSDVLSLLVTIFQYEMLFAGINKGNNIDVATMLHI